MMCLLNPGMRALMIRKTMVSLSASGIVTWNQFVIPEARMTGLVTYFGGSLDRPPGYQYTNGSFVAVGGMNDPLKVMSTEYDLIYVQEAIELTPTDWENLTTRLRNGKVSFQQLIADTNPDKPSHWLKQRVDRGDTILHESRHTDNPRLYDSNGEMTEDGRAYMARLDKLTGVRKLRLKGGKWTSAEGLVYDGWDDAVNVIDSFPIPKEWVRVWGVDFGFTNPFVLQCWAIDPDGRLYLYREIYHTRRLVEDHARQILSLVRRPRDPEATPDWKDHSAWEWTEPRPQAIVCDHDAEGRATLERALAIGTKAAYKKVSDGIEYVQRRIAPAGDGRPRIFIMRDALVERDAQLDEEMKPCDTLSEISGYVWDTKDGKPPKEEPVKEDDHGMDTMRYVVCERDKRGRVNVRFI